MNHVDKSFDDLLQLKLPEIKIYTGKDACRSKSTDGTMQYSDTYCKSLFELL